MTFYQKTILIVFSSLTVLLLLMEYNGINGDILSYSRYLTMILLCVAVFYRRGGSEVQKNLSWTFLLMLLGDFFLVLSYGIRWFPHGLRSLGFVPFAIAYAIMLKSYLRGYQWNIHMMVPTMIYIAQLYMLIRTINPFVTGIERYAGLLTALFVSLMAWAGSASVFMGYYNKRVSAMMAISGLLMVVCDYGVAMDIFHPDSLSIRSAMPINIVWMTYLPGWLILGLVVVDRDIFNGVYHGQKQVYNK